MKTCPRCGYAMGLERPRSTGRYSQSAHLHGHLRQIADFCGYHLSEIKDVLKEDLSQWPTRTVTIGQTTQNVPISEADASSAVESAAIDWCHQRAAELGIALRED